MAYDAAVVGDYEFAWTTDTLAARVAASEFPWLAANVTDTSGEGRAAWARNWILVERGGRRIAIVGLATASPTDTVNPLDVARLTFEDPETTLARLLPEIRGANPDVVIALAHGGTRCDPACREEPIAEGLSPGSVDLVVTGHGSGRVRATATGIPVVPVGHPGEVAVVDLIRRAAGHLEVRLRMDTVWTDAVTPDTAVARIVAGYSREIERVLTRRVATMKFALPAPTEREGPLGRLVADAFRNAGRGDVALLRADDLQGGLPGGPVTYRDVRAVLPASMRLFRIEVTGEALLAALERALTPDAPAAYVSGLSVRYDPDRPAGRRVRGARLADGRQVDRRARYALVVPEVLAAGGGGYGMLAGGAPALVDVLDVEALIRYLGLLPQPAEAPDVARFISTR
jgi:2',3'-cyclic-nucleotide 2'-phosphodiesterase (5'-nucleotidase family)